MKVIIFLDRDNFEGSFKLINKNIEKGKKRFWRLEKYTAYLVKKLGSRLNIKEDDLKLIKILLYSGKYNSEVLYKFKRRCYQKLNEIDESINNEKRLLQDISQNRIDSDIREKINNHVQIIKSIFENRKKNIINSIKKQERNYEGQKGFLENIKKMPLVEPRMIKLRQAGGRIYQKGVDVSIATDLVHLAHNEVYDIALLLGGDSDLSEATKLVKDALKKIVVVVSYYNPEDPLNSNTCPELIKSSSHFINLKDFEMSELELMSDLMREKANLKE